MEKFLRLVNLFFASIGGALGVVLGEVDGPLYALITFMVIDYITEVMITILNKKLSSEVGFCGVSKKITILAFVTVGYVIDQRIIGEGGVIRTAVIFFYLSNEGISIIENASVIGLPVPKKLREVLEKLKGEKDDEGE